jgi:hypothetical protein
MGQNGDEDVGIRFSFLPWVVMACRGGSAVVGEGRWCRLWAAVLWCSGKGGRWPWGAGRGGELSGLLIVGVRRFGGRNFELEELRQWWFEKVLRGLRPVGLAANPVLLDATRRAGRPGCGRGGGRERRRDAVVEVTGRQRGE